MTNNTAFRFISAIESLDKLYEGQTLPEICEDYLQKRAGALGYTAQDGTPDERRTAAILACATSTFDQTEGRFLMEVFQNLPPVEKEALIREAKITGIDGEHAIDLYYLTPIIGNSRQFYENAQDPDSFTKSLRVGLRAWAQTYLKTRELLDAQKRRGDGIVTANLRDLATVARNDPESLLAKNIIIEPSIDDEDTIEAHLEKTQQELIDWAFSTDGGPYEAAVFDLDGTLVYHEEDIAENVDKLLKLAESGFPVLLSTLRSRVEFTGGRPRSIVAFANDLIAKATTEKQKNNIYISTENGAEISSLANYNSRPTPRFELGERGTYELSSIVNTIIDEMRTSSVLASEPQSFPQTAFFNLGGFIESVDEAETSERDIFLERLAHEVENNPVLQKLKLKIFPVGDTSITIAPIEATKLNPLRFIAVEKGIYDVNNILKIGDDTDPDADGGMMIGRGSFIVTFAEGDKIGPPSTIYANNQINIDEEVIEMSQDIKRPSDRGPLRTAKILELLSSRGLLPQLTAN